MNTALSVVAHESCELTFNDRQMEIIRKQIAPGCSDDELAYFLEVCRATGLNPIQRQVYAIKRISGGESRMTIQTGIDGYRLLAARTGALAGIDDATYDTDEGDHPGRATVTVWRLVAGQRVPFSATARWREYVALNKEGHPLAMWAKMPWLMLGKCAEALALRKAFPNETSGIYTAEEMAQADNGTLPLAGPIIEEQPAPARFNPLDDVDIKLKLQQLGRKTTQERRATLATLFREMQEQGIEWNKDNLAKALDAEAGKQAQASLAGLPVGTRGN